jgi:hypothetical protein
VNFAWFGSPVGFRDKKAGGSPADKANSGLKILDIKSQKL